MITIPVTVTGDHWLNPEQVKTSLVSSNPQESLVLDICAEGPSLWRLGVIDMVLTHCEQARRDPSTVYISRWSNPVESIPFQRTHRSDVSHFYWISGRYCPTAPITCEQGKLWGFFMGRPTVPRLLLLKTLASEGQALLSRMLGGLLPGRQGIDLDLQEFGDPADLIAWYQDCGIGSLDGATIRDQYNPEKNTNKALLDFYDRFHVELVVESYLYGETFFPTEKTVRPLSAGKPFVVMGPRHFLRRLKDQGFRTWGDLWDESYDQLEGRPRLAAIQQLIRDLHQQRDCILPQISQHSTYNRAILVALADKHRPRS